MNGFLHLRKPGTHSNIKKIYFRAGNTLAEKKARHRAGAMFIPYFGLIYFLRLFTYDSNALTPLSVIDNKVFG